MRACVRALGWREGTAAGSFEQWAPCDACAHGWQAHYYANRNASNVDAPGQLALAYALATASAVGAAVGVGAWADRLQAGRRARGCAHAAAAAAAAARGVRARVCDAYRVRSAVKSAARRCAPLAGVALADVLNISVMRASEWRHGACTHGRAGRVIRLPMLPRWRQQRRRWARYECNAENLCQPGRRHQYLRRCDGGVCWHVAHRGGVCGGGMHLFAGGRCARGRA